MGSGQDGSSGTGSGLNEDGAGLEGLADGMDSGLSLVAGRLDSDSAPEVSLQKQGRQVLYQEYM